MSALELRSIGHRFPGADHPTLSGIDLEVADGSMLAVLGPSGSGKTTLLRVTAGLDAPETGEVLLDGRPVTHLPPEDRGLTVMFQQPHLFQHLDVVGNVAFGPRLRGCSRRAARDAAERYLELVHLSGLGSRRPRQLSGGQQQRVALARALATERTTLLLDEPFSSLDPELRQSMHGLLGEVRAALAPTVVMVTHDLDEASLADRVAVLAAGRLEQVAPAEDLYARPASLLVARLVGGFNEIPGTVVDGEHHSTWGRLPLPHDCTVAGPATLLVRREQLTLTCDPSAGVGGREEAGVPGRVLSTSMAGPRQVVQVEPAHRPAGVGDRVEVELPVGQRARIGDHVRVHVGAGGRLWAVSSPDERRREALVDTPA